MNGWWRFLAWAGLMLILGLVPVLVGFGIGDLPDPVASHWGIDGRPDGHLPLAGLPLVVLGMIGVALLTTSLFRIEGRPTAEAVAVTGLMGGLGLSLMASLVILNAGAPSWEHAETFSAPHVLAALLAATAGGIAGYLLGKRWYPIPKRSPAVSPALDIADGEAVSWFGSTRVVWPYALLGVAGLLFLSLPGWFKGMAVLFVILAFLFSHVVVVVGGDSLQVRLGGGLKVKTVRLSNVSGARPIDLEPAGWGGWGWRVVPSGTAIVLRRGDAIELTYVSGRRFAVTVDDAATGSAVVNGLVARLAREG